MKTKIVQIGNSKGIRIPKVMLEQSGLGEEVQLEVKKQKIIIGPVNKPRQGWVDAFKKMAEQADDRLLDGQQLANKTSWDKNEWTW